VIKTNLGQLFNGTMHRFFLVLLLSTVTVLATQPPFEYVHEETFGLFNLSSCTGAKPCGEAMYTFLGVSAKSNGAQQCTGSSCGGHGDTGYHYQCVELAQRFFAVKYNVHPTIWGGNAKDLCTVHPSTVHRTSSPRPGDLAVRTSGTYGHVMVIMDVRGSEIDVMEQNSSPTGRNTYRMSDMGCYLRADGAEPTGPSCAGHPDGLRCGHDGIHGDANVLYKCISGKIASQAKCPQACATIPGANDRCATGTCKAGMVGDYCGNDRIDGDKTMLYTCHNGQITKAQLCPRGCVIHPGANDKCA